jgi:tetratricopeptide (TPR) repeat protein
MVGRPSEESTRDEDRESAYSLLQRGHELMQRRHHAQAAIVLARAERAEPGKGSIIEALGRAYYNSGQHERARETFERLLEVDPSAHYAHYALGQSLKQLRRVREARTHLRMAVALDPRSRLYRGALDRLGPPDETPPGPGAPGDHGVPADRGAADDPGAPRDRGAADDRGAPRDRGAADDRAAPGAADAAGAPGAADADADAASPEEDSTKDREG